MSNWDGIMGEPEERQTKEWLAYTEHNAKYNKGAYSPDYASIIIYADTKKEALEQAHDLFGKWGHVEFRKATKVTRIKAYA